MLHIDLCFPFVLSNIIGRHAYLCPNNYYFLVDLKCVRDTEELSVVLNLNISSTFMLQPEVTQIRCVAM